MNHTVALPGSMIWMGIRLSSGSRPQSPKGPSTALTQSVFCSYGPVVVEWPEMLCAWSSQYPHRPIPPDQSRSVYRSSAAPAVLQRAPYCRATFAITTNGSGQVEKAPALDFVERIVRIGDRRKRNDVFRFQASDRKLATLKPAAFSHELFQRGYLFPTAGIAKADFPRVTARLLPRSITR